MINKTLEQRIEQLPEVQAGKEVYQNHWHQFDVYTHTMKVVEYTMELTQDPELIVAAYLHDIGKPAIATPRINKETGEKEYSPENKPYHKFANHEGKGREMVEELESTIFEEYNLNQERIANLVGWHYLPMKGIEAMRKATTYTEFLKKYHRLERVLSETGEKENILTIFLADCKGKGSRGALDQPELELIREALLTPDYNLREIYELQQKTYGKKEAA